MQKLHHENIVKCLAIYKPTPTDPRAYLVLELMTYSLYDLLQHRRTYFSEAEARPIFQRIVKATKHCHARGIIHHDLKTANVLVSISE